MKFSFFEGLLLFARTGTARRLSEPSFSLSDYFPQFCNIFGEWFFLGGIRGGIKVALGDIWGVFWEVFGG